MDEDDDGALKPHQASMDDEFLRHPFSNSLVRNPLKSPRREDGVLAPVVWSDAEFRHNRLEEALQGWKTIRVDASSLNAMSGDTLPSLNSMSDVGATSPRPLALSARRAMLGTLRELPKSWEFYVSLDKSTFVEKPKSRRRKAEPVPIGMLIVAKLLIDIDVIDSGRDQALKVEAVDPKGVVAAWNRDNPLFEVGPGDHIIGVNKKSGDGEEMITELNEADLLRLTVRRHSSRRASKASTRRGASKGNNKTLKLPSINPEAHGQ